jgi:hypothetical protein
MGERIAALLPAVLPRAIFAWIGHGSFSQSGPRDRSSAGFIALPDLILTDDLRSKMPCHVLCLAGLREWWWIPWCVCRGRP